MKQYLLYNIIDLIYELNDYEFEILKKDVNKNHIMFYIEHMDYDFYIHKTKHDIDDDSFFFNNYYYTFISDSSKQNIDTILKQFQQLIK